MAKKSKQMLMFESGEDLPLFTGTPAKGVDAGTAPNSNPPAPGLFECGFCQDTGYLYYKTTKTKIRCGCHWGNGSWIK